MVTKKSAPISAHFGLRKSAGRYFSDEPVDEMENGMKQVQPPEGICPGTSDFLLLQNIRIILLHSKLHNSGD